MTRIVLCEGDITNEEVDAIVNAANSALVLGSGVAGAIARRGGPAVAEACAAHGPIEVGEAAVTGAGDLAARLVIHAAGMPPGGQVSEASLRSCLRAALALAEREGCRTVACPAIGAGVGGLSLQTCAEISLAEARRVAEEGSALEEIRFVLFGEPAYRVFEMVNDAAKVEAQMRRLRERS
ncbi:MAG: macro domain-containing protein [Spirochaetaceae bacterium]|nr:macro domain-containing protein [Myxococcales bacterium]MCB9726772.1 macro domain-containing protein [Spirochaetaceae bacterium]